MAGLPALVAYPSVKSIVICAFRTFETGPFFSAARASSASAWEPDWMRRNFKGVSQSHSLTVSQESGCYETVRLCGYETHSNPYFFLFSNNVFRLIPRISAARE